MLPLTLPSPLIDERPGFPGTLGALGVWGPFRGPHVAAHVAFPADRRAPRVSRGARSVGGCGGHLGAPHVQVWYAEKRTVDARAWSSVITLTSAGLPDAYARSSAGRISLGFSTNSPWAPRSIATRS